MRMFSELFRPLVEKIPTLSVSAVGTNALDQFGMIATVLARYGFLTTDDGDRLFFQRERMQAT